MEVIENEKYFLISILIGAVIAGILSLIPIWHLVLIAGIAAGLFNRTMKKGTLAGGAGVCIWWLIYMIYGMVAIGAYSLMDQFGALLIGSGFGWLIFLIILLVGTLIGALGGSIGSAIMISIKGYESSEVSNAS
jgi:hypothetical protein